MRIVFMVEEPSMKCFLEGLLPRIIPNICYIIISHNGKSDLQDSIPKKLQGWYYPDDVFVIIQDQDQNDCLKLKDSLKALAAPYSKTVLIRIACHELEAWYWGDLMAVSAAYHKNVTALSLKRQYRNPDLIENPKAELRKIIPAYQQLQGARLLSSKIDVARNTSRSFQVFISSVQKLAAQITN